jgi:hypothetical protein
MPIAECRLPIGRFIGGSAIGAMRIQSGECRSRMRNASISESRKESPDRQSAMDATH